MRRRLIAGLCAALCAAVAYGQLRDKPPGTGQAEAYKVTPWPGHGGADQKYEDEVQEHLNRMAADGWRFHSDLAGQFGKLMVFERASGR